MSSGAASTPAESEKDGPVASDTPSPAGPPANEPITGGPPGDAGGQPAAPPPPVPEGALPINVTADGKVKPKAAPPEAEHAIYDPANVRKTEKIEKAETRLQANPYDTDAWTAILAEVQTANIDTFRCYFDRFLKLFPTAGHYWKIYLDREIKQKNYGRVERLFKKHLLNCLSLDLWRGYLAYVKDTKQDQPNYQDVLQKTYDFVLEHVGMDINSTPVWQEYIDVIKSRQATNTYEEGQKMTALRQIYQKAVVNPVVNVEQLWKDYDSYENGLNKLTAKKLLQDRSAAYMTARSVYRERKLRTEGIIRNLLATPPKGTAKERQQLKLWREYLEWERGDPLRLDNPALVEKRVVFAYKQCLLCLTHHQEIWFDLCRYLVDQGKKEQAAAMYEKAIAALPTNVLLHCAYTDLMEGSKNVSRAAQVYERLLANKDVKDPTLAYVQYMKFRKRVSGFMGARAVFKRARGDVRCKHHIYVASALMEYYSSKTADTAVKIFELGMRSYQGNQQYVLAYLDFLSSLTEDHNTRVLFERILNTIKPEDAGPVWTRFLHFESDYGELEAALRVEARRQEAMSTRAITQAIERYKYMDLVPCSRLELDLCDYAQQAGSSDANPADLVPAASTLHDTQHYPMPDMSQWVPFNPEHGTATGREPAVLRELLRHLPPPSSFSGPYANVDMLLDMVLGMTNVPSLPNTSAAAEASVAGAAGKARPTADKRKKEAGGEAEEAQGRADGVLGPRDPSQDIFRKRQRQQLAQ